MTVYKYFLKIALKNKWTILGYVTIFFIMTLIVGAGTNQGESEFMDTKLNIGIIDNSNSQLSLNLIDYLGKKHHIVDTIDDEVYIKEQIFLERLDGVVVIPEDFQEKFINKEEAIEIYSDERKMESMGIQSQINKFLIFANATYENGDFDFNKVNLALKEKSTVNLIDKSERNTSINEWFRYYYNFTSYVIMGVYIAVIGVVMAEFSEENINSRMKISSKNLFKFNMEIYLGQLTIASIITFVFIMGSVILRGKYLKEIDFYKYISNVVVFSFSILCFTFFINNLTKNKFVISGISTVLSLGISFLSGVMVSQDLLGEKTLSLAKFFPAYYYINLNDTIIDSFSDMGFNLLMQLLFAFAFILMGLYFSKIKQQN